MLSRVINIKPSDVISFEGCFVFQVDEVMLISFNNVYFKSNIFYIVVNSVSDDGKRWL